MKLALNYNPEYKREVPKILKEFDQWQNDGGQIIFKVEPKENSNQIILNFFDLGKEGNEDELYRRLMHIAFEIALHKKNLTLTETYLKTSLETLWDCIEKDIERHLKNIPYSIQPKEEKKDELVNYSQWLTRWQEELLKVAERFHNKVPQCNFYILFPDSDNVQKIQIIPDEIKIWDSNLLAKKYPICIPKDEGRVLDILYIMVVKNNWVSSDHFRKEFKNIVSFYKTKAMLKYEDYEEDSEISMFKPLPLFHDQMNKMEEFSIFEIKEPEILEEFSFKLSMDLGYRLERNQLSAEYIFPYLINILPAVLLNIIAEYCDFSFEEIKQGERKQKLLTQFIIPLQWKFVTHPGKQGKQYIEFNQREHYNRACTFLDSYRYSGLMGYRKAALRNNIEVYPDLENEIKTVQASLR